MKDEHSVLSKELIKIELPPSKIWKAFKIFHDSNASFIYFFDKTKFSCTTPFRSFYYEIPIDFPFLHFTSSITIIIILLLLLLSLFYESELRFRFGFVGRNSDSEDVNTCRQITKTKILRLKIAH